MSLPHEHWERPEDVGWVLPVLEQPDDPVQKDQLLVVSVSKHTERETCFFSR